MRAQNAQMRLPAQPISLIFQESIEQKLQEHFSAAMQVLLVVQKDTTRPKMFVITALRSCEKCIIDYDECIKCKIGWDYDRNKNKCIRATLGLAAVVLALSAIFLILAVITCICACKL